MPGPRHKAVPAGRRRTTCASFGFHDLAARSAYQPTIKRQGERWIAYIGSHGGRMHNPLTGQMEENGTSILDVTDPRAPRLLAHIPGELGREVPGRETGGAQMTRVCSGSELPKADPKKTYLLRSFGDSRQETYDVSSPEKPLLLARFGQFRSTHKNEWECGSGIAYIPGSHEAYRASRVTHVYDLSDPARPQFIRAFGLRRPAERRQGLPPRPDPRTDVRLAGKGARVLRLRHQCARRCADRRP